MSKMLKKVNPSNPKLWLLIGIGLVGAVVVVAETRRRRRRKLPKPDFGAFVERFELLPIPQPNQTQTLSALTFAIKDIFDVKGYVTGFGNPQWKKMHNEAGKTAIVITALLSNGATCVGKTVMDEFSFGISGENKFYGTPTNPQMPSSIPGGSSSGSAVAVAARLVDFAMGTDTTGCVRIPAAFCGILGFRPSHGVISTIGVLPNAQSLDTVETLGESRGFGPRGKESWWWNENVQSKVRVKKECFKEWSRCKNSETWDKYKIARNETKKAVSEARAQAFDGLYQALGTRDGERSIYRLAKGRERKTRDLDQVKCVKDEEDKVLVHEKDIKERWKAYFHNLFNDGYGYDSSSLDTREEDRNYKYYRRIQKQEVKEALKRMSNGKAVGPDNIPIEVWKTLGDRGLEWLTELFNEIMRSKRMPEEWRRSTLVPIYKNKGDIQNCANYRGIKLMSHTMKLWERVIERRLRKETQVTENQFGFMPGRSTMEAIYLLRRVMEQYRMAQQDLHLIFIDLEKAYDRVLREILWKALEKKGVRVAYIRAIQDMYDRVSTSVRTQGGESDDFPITIGLHQGSTLSPYLFTLILDVLTEQIQEIAPRCMVFADDIVLLGESREELNERLETWRRALETHGFRLSRSKSEYMECKFNKRRRVSNSEVKIGDHIIPQVTRFKYLGSVIQDDGEIEGDVNHRIQAGWMKWRKASGVLCDAKVPIKLKGKFYRTAVRPAILYGTECWAVKSQHENKVGVAEMRMLRWMCGKTRQDKIRNETIRERVGVAPIVEKVVENRLRWFGHVERRPVDSVVRRVDQMERRQTIRGRGRPKKTIREVIKKDLEINGLDRRWFARDPSVLHRVGLVLLPLNSVELKRTRRIIFADDLFQLCKAPSQKTVYIIGKAIENLSGYQFPQHMNLCQYIASNVPSLKEFREKFTHQQNGVSILKALTSVMFYLQGYEFKTNHEEWVKSVKPRLGRGMSERVNAAMNATHDNIKTLYKVRTEMRGAFQHLLKDDGILVIPTVADYPLKLNTEKGFSSEFGDRAFALSSIASISGCCQVAIPLGCHNDCCASVSLISAHGADKFLLNTVLDMYSTLQEQVSVAYALPLPDTNGSMGTSELLKEKFFCVIGVYPVKLYSFQEAEEDCNMAILHDKKNVKAYLRRGTARELLLRYKEALKEQPLQGNLDVLVVLKSCTGVISSMLSFLNHRTRLLVLQKKDSENQRVDTSCSFNTDLPPPPGEC
ncbi:Outer envelope protein 64, mitochondrial [Glycine soja]